MAVWSEISGMLRDEIAGGAYPPGARLPTEAVLAQRFGVNRHTVRRALADLAGQGLVHARRGAGVFVTARPTVYPLGRRVRFHQIIAAEGRTPSRQIRSVDTRPATAAEALGLGLAAGSQVHVVEGVSLADGQPLAAFRSVFPAARFPDLPAAIRSHGSITEALRACGLPDYTRAETRLTAQSAPAVLALALQVAEGSAVLRSVAVNVDAGVVPVEHGTTWFAGERVTLTVSPD
ncbi:MAG: phosphonate metabolism transcriptional regulator PhnF [Tabrizicola sp.]|uniref:phosphonate metabolism transcriptional regulator PhnF n=1 Tax=Tabrizicola sp. TaxID=2005166 RepID=UPI0027360A3F|nr:phosphonate metabolism transcriptional regulator PhnF [Tabrizicola sp.]MDP3263955.1 phosphonate metabolism transcriptional regulator PhnF [Tabrizicola sp.]MDP3647320.1 phosphonate metabolism transcriptional regulator PhnF [Paracoccaceae bacterium]MDZ4068760.1 phosphonate metabolism transcriptional regulator PhnF [Tabrizicola sp.]MDZ4303945.1 phosphonate metabolism transcriptional regulator PhnF [Pseudomonas sp.]